MKEENHVFIDDVMDNLNKITEQAAESINCKDTQTTGKLMYEYYNELRKTGISTEKLDRIINIAKENGALGAKPTGGWGGGCCLVLASNQKHAEELAKIFDENGFKSFQTKIGVSGIEAF